jgi:hypothetical protein
MSRIRGFRTAVYGIVAISMLFLVAQIMQSRCPQRSGHCTASLPDLVALLFCIPSSANWDRTIPNAKNGSLAAEFILVGTINLLIDVSSIVLPMTMLWNL